MQYKRIIPLATDEFKQGCLELLPIVIRFIDYMYNTSDTALHSIEVSDQGEEMTVMFSCSRYAGRIGAIFMTRDETGRNGFLPVITEYRIVGAKQMVYQKILDHFFDDFNNFLEYYQREV